MNYLALLKFHSNFKATIKQSLLRLSRASAHAKKPFIFPTALGVSYGVLVLVFIFMSVNNKNNLIFLFSFFLFSMGLVTTLKANANLEKIDIDLVSHPLFFKNEKALIKYKIINQSKKPCYEIRIRTFIDADTSSATSADIQIIHIPELKPFASQIIQIEVIPLSTGLLAWPHLILESYFPMQFVRTWKITQAQKEILVYPEKINYFGLEKPLQNSNSKIRKTMTSSSEDKEFAYSTEAHEITSDQKINWKLYAKTDHLYVNQFDHPLNEDHFYEIDFNHTKSLNDIDKQKSQFTYWVDYLYQNNFNFSARLGSFKINIEKHQEIKVISLLNRLLKNK